MRTVLSQEPDANVLESFENATEFTLLLWPSRFFNVCPVVTSQMHTVLSSEPDANVLQMKIF